MELINTVTPFFLGMALVVLFVRCQKSYRNSRLLDQYRRLGQGLDGKLRELASPQP